MIDIKEKLIISIANENYEEIIEIATKYKKIELRLSQINLTNNQILKIIDCSDSVVITDISKLEERNDFHKINFNNNQLEKIIIDCPFENLKNKNLISYIENINIKKILSYHQWNKIENIEKIETIENIFLFMLHKLGKNIHKYFIIKIAVLIESINELEILFSIYNKYSDFNFILIPLGKKFQKSRIKSLELGAKYMFCYVNQPVTDCQLAYKEYIK